MQVNIPFLFASNVFLEQTFVLCSITPGVVLIRKRAKAFYAALIEFEH